MNVDHLDCLFQEYGYDVKERTASYRVYLLNQGMYHGAEIQIMDDDIDATPILDRYSKLGYHAKQQRFKSIEQAESYLFKGFFNTQTTANDINRRYTEFAANQVKHYCNCGIKYQYISMPYSIYSEGAEDTVSGTSDIISAIKEAINRKGAHLVVVEAAAGFGKTCTAYEVYKSFLDNSEYQKPIFTELSRNRDAKQFKEESRLLNGIYATLESSEWSMLTLFDRLSYSQYKNKVWNSMLRNKMRVRFADKGLSEELCKYLSNNNKTAKLLYRANRTKILKLVMEKGFAYPLTYDTVLHLINHIIVKDKILANFEDKVLKRDMDIMFGEL